MRISASLGMKRGVRLPVNQPYHQRPGMGGIIRHREVEQPTCILAYNDFIELSGPLLAKDGRWRGCQYLCKGV